MKRERWRADRHDLGRRETVEDASIELVLSAVSSWEIAIKNATGRLPLPVPVERLVPDRMQATGVSALSVQHAHTVEVPRLPPHHKDPFDRLLVAQAMVCSSSHQSTKRNSGSSDSMRFAVIGDDAIRAKRG